MQRAARTATALPIGLAILEMLQEERLALIAAAEQQRPPVSAVSALLLARFGAAEMKRALARQIVGLGVRAVLDEAGFEVSHAGVRLKDDVLFSTGSSYRRRSNTADAPDACGVFDRMAKALTLDDARRALRALLLHFPQLRAEAADSNSHRGQSEKARPQKSRHRNELVKQKSLR
jgi:hypothetical protein